MNTIALVNPQTLVGAELATGLARHKELFGEIRLLTSEESDEAVLTEFDGAAALVQPLSADALAGVDLAFFCGPMATLPELPAGATAILVGAETPPEGARAVVAGVNLEAATGASLIASPHAGVIVLAHLLHPLAPLGTERAVAWLVQPATQREQPGLDELMDQTRDLLTFSEDSQRTVFGRQLAFNLLPTATVEAPFVQTLAGLLPDPPRLAVHLVQGGVFHSFAASLFVTFDPDPGLEAVQGALDAHPHLRRAEEPHLLGPIEAAARDDILLGGVTAAAATGSYWLWAVMDNLTRGGATNALEIAAAVLASR